MRTSKRILLAVVGLMTSLGTMGCVAEEGVRSGLQGGVAAAVSALIQAPVNAWLDATFAG
jgi:hypothetical protein